MRMSDYVYQHGLSQMHSEEMYDGGGRKQKAMKTVAVLGDYLAREDRDPADMTLLPAPAHRPVPEARTPELGAVVG